MFESKATYMDFWGKARSSPGFCTENWHPAALHMLDVAAVAHVWLAATKPIIPGLGANSDTAWSSIVTLIAMHDIGKFSLPFQAKRDDLWPPCLGPIRRMTGPRHDTAGYGLVMSEAFAVHAQPFFSQLFGAMRPSGQGILWRAVCGHHGSPPLEDDFPSHTFNDPARAAAAAFIADLFALLRPTPLIGTISRDSIVALSWWLAGLTVLADWIGSAETWFRYHRDVTSLVDYWPLAQQRARDALAEAGLRLISPNPASPSAALLRANRPTPLQDYLSHMDLGPTGVPALIIVEDQTGSGKTEAALILAHRLMTEKGARGLFIALPTMATANALHERLSIIYRALFEPGAEPSLVLTHGKRNLNDRFAAALARGAVQSETAMADADETASAQCAAWIGQDRRRAFMADCGVGTIDQALHGVLPTRHAPLRMFGLSQRVLVIDEAHAYDAYMQEELLWLVAFQARLGGSTIILSATLPLAGRQKLVDAFNKAAGYAGAIVVGKDYPLVTVGLPDGPVEHPLPPRSGLARTMEVHRLADQNSALEAVVAAAARGAAVAWIRNTVDDAAAAHAMLAGRGVDAILFHARFAMGDRLAIEGHVQACFGKASRLPQRARVVVGTQVMEQSLDVDFDVMFTDIAPIDLLLQRAGRLWRHPDRTRQETAPRLYVVAPDPVSCPQKDWLFEFRGTARIYENHGVLWRSARAVFERPVINVPDDVRNLVETVYGPDAPVPPGLAAASGKAEGADSASRAVAWQNLLTWKDGYAQGSGAWASDILTPSRLAEPGCTYRIGRWTGAEIMPWYEHGDKSWPMSEITMPSWRVGSVVEESGARAAAVAALRAGWSRWEQDVPVLLLDPDGIGTLQDTKGRPLPVYYSRNGGLKFKQTL